MGPPPTLLLSSLAEVKMLLCRNSGDLQPREMRTRVVRLTEIHFGISLKWELGHLII